MSLTIYCPTRHTTKAQSLQISIPKYANINIITNTNKTNFNINFNTKICQCQNISTSQYTNFNIKIYHYRYECHQYRYENQYLAPVTLKLGHMSLCYRVLLQQTPANHRTCYMLWTNAWIELSLFSWLPFLKWESC